MLGPGFSLQGGGPALTISPRVIIEVARLGNSTVEIVVPLHVSHASATAFGLTVTTWAFELVPAGRLTFPLVPKLSAYGEVGLGVGHFRYSMPMTFYGYVNGTATGVEFTFSAGLQYLLTEQIALYAEPIGLHAFAGGGASVQVGAQTMPVATGSGANWCLLFGAAWRVPLGAK